MLSFDVAYVTLLLLLLLSIEHVASFSSVRVASLHQQPILRQHHHHQHQQPLLTSAASCIKSSKSNRVKVWVPLHAGGFEWEDPGEAFDQGVENPFKKNAALSEEQEGNMKIDPARLLGPRLGGTNLYFVGMMGTGKSTVGNIVARRECTLFFALSRKEWSFQEVGDAAAAAAMLDSSTTI
jgi:hypothetical protein